MEVTLAQQLPELLSEVAVAAEEATQTGGSAELCQRSVQQMFTAIGEQFDLRLRMNNIEEIDDILGNGPLPGNRDAATESIACCTLFLGMLKMASAADYSEKLVPPDRLNEMAARLLLHSIRICMGLGLDPLRLLDQVIAETKHQVTNPTEEQQELADKLAGEHPLSILERIQDALTKRTQG